MDHLAVLQAKYRQVARLLAETYGYPTWRQRLPPVDELVCTILSQSTSDVNRDKAFTQLKARFPTWEAVRDAPARDVIAAIRQAGLSETKGPRIQQVLRQIGEECGGVSLDCIADMDVEAAKNWLTRFNGVGPKTAAIVLLFAFEKPAFPVDTHVHRVTQRLGLIGPKTTREQAHVDLEKIIPPDQFYQAHLNLIEHGRTLCQARRPLCERCPLTALCDYYEAAYTKEHPA
jgi:endonuclease-3